MSKQNTQEETIINLNPNTVEIIEETNHPLYDKRGISPISKEFLSEIESQGVRAPIHVARVEGYKEHVVVAGRRRLLAARKANLGSIPAILLDLDLAGLQRWMISENEHRLADNHVAKAEKAQGYFGQLVEQGFSNADARKEVASAFGVSTKMITNWMDIINLSPKVKSAIEKGKISYELALTWKDLSHEQQERKLLSAQEKASRQKGASEVSGEEKVTAEHTFVLGVSKVTPKQLNLIRDYAQTPNQFKLLFSVLTGKVAQEDMDKVNEKFPWLVEILG